MPQGTLTVFEEFKKTIGDGTHDMDTNAFKLALITTIPTEADASPSLDNYTEVTGSNYTAGGLALTTTWTESAGISDFIHTGGTLVWLQHATGPTNIKAGVIYNTTSAVTNAAVCFIDFTSDGVTPVSLADGDITWTPEAVQSRIFTLT
mgnify:CR=1 FL=1